MEDKIEIAFVGLTHMPPNNAALILKEVYGDRSIPIVIGLYEAQVIAYTHDKVKPLRPVVHDVVKELIDMTEVLLLETLIYDYNKGTYFTKLVFEDEDNNVVEIECRLSDAVAISLRCSAPIYTTKFVLNEAGLTTYVEGNLHNSPHNLAYNNAKTKIEQLQNQLERAIKMEDYETAAQIRDEIKNYLEN
ncbi:MAG: bifunctional nuclease family protein [Bacteroidetes bacterium]|nr:bifunctional nuclease family protein [Bacteroidota bacterium]